MAAPPAAQPGFRKRPAGVCNISVADAVLAELRMLASLGRSGRTGSASSRRVSCSRRSIGRWPCAVALLPDVWARSGSQRARPRALAVAAFKQPIPIRQSRRPKSGHVKLRRDSRLKRSTFALCSLCPIRCAQPWHESRSCLAASPKTGMKPGAVALAMAFRFDDDGTHVVVKHFAWHAPMAAKACSWQRPQGTRSVRSGRTRHTWNRPYSRAVMNEGRKVIAGRV